LTEARGGSHAGDKSSYRKPSEFTALYSRRFREILAEPEKLELEKQKYKKTSQTSCLTLMWEWQ
jgi:hypothetical protein